MDGYTLSISRCSGGDGVEESFKAKIKRREAALDAFAVAEAYCKESWMVSRCEREGFDGFIIDLCSDAEDETMTWGSRSDGAREGMNMGKEKIEEKDVRLLRYAVEQAFDGAMRDGALALLNRLVDSASEAANLEEELLNLKGEYQRSMENSKRGAFKRLDAVYKRKCRREKRMAKGQMLCADGKPVMFGETLYGGDGRDWLIVGIAGAWSYDVYGLHVAHDGKKEKKPLRAEWLVHELTDAGEEV